MALFKTTKDWAGYDFATTELERVLGPDADLLDQFPQERYQNLQCAHEQLEAQQYDKPTLEIIHPDYGICRVRYIELDINPEAPNQGRKTFILGGGGITEAESSYHFGAALASLGHRVILLPNTWSYGVEMDPDAFARMYRNEVTSNEVFRPESTIMAAAVEVLADKHQVGELFLLGTSTGACVMMRVAEHLQYTNHHLFGKIKGLFLNAPAGVHLEKDLNSATKRIRRRLQLALGFVHETLGLMQDPILRYVNMEASAHIKGEKNKADIITLPIRVVNNLAERILPTLPLPVITILSRNDKAISLKTTQHALEEINQSRSTSGYSAIKVYVQDGTHSWIGDKAIPASNLVHALADQLSTT